MKKNGFTLAEVLITLAIIGVVATLTLPALMNNTQEQQAKTALKKGINTLTEAAQMNAAIDGFDYGSLKNSSTTDSETQSMYSILAKRASLDLRRSGIKASETDAYGATTAGDFSDPVSGDNYVMFFRDGSILMYDPASSISDDAREISEEDNLPVGFGAIYDTNGTKGPNILSNCQSDANGDVDSDAQTEDTLTEQCGKKNRVIKDQFSIQLRGSVAVPLGSAARWATEN